jgi:hypothetical protein
MSKLVRTGRREWNVLLLTYLLFTGVNYAICGWPLYIGITGGWFSQHVGWAVVLWLAALIILPALIGFIAGFANQRLWVDTFLNRIGVDTVAPVLTGWDWAFNERGPEWVIVTLETGKIIYGVYGYASSDPTERDIFLAEAWTVDEYGIWQPVNRSRGVLIRNKAIVSVEFLAEES